MPTYVLEGGSSATLPAKPLTIRVQGQRQAEVRIEARHDGVPDPTAISRPGMLVLPRVAAPVEIRVVPTSERTFGSGTVVALSAATELRGETDPERALMNGVDLSGLAQRELLRVEPMGAELKLTALGVVEDAPLPPLAARARDVARELLGMERVPSTVARPLEVIVDASASMRALALEGAVGAALELVAGVSRVTAADDPLTVAVATDRPTPVTADSLVELPRAVHEAVLDTPLATGFRSRSSLQVVAHGSPNAAGPPDTQVARCVVSDGVPADLVPVDSELRQALVVICTASARDVLTARAPHTTAWVPMADWGGVPAYQFLMENDAALRAAVTEILRSLLPADLALQSRLGDTPGGAMAT